MRSIIVLLCIFLLNACAAKPATPADGGAATPTSASPTAPAAVASPGLQAVIEGARREGGLTLVWGEGSLGGAEGARRFAERVNALYGLRLDVNYTPGPSNAAMVAKILEETQTGRPATTDVILASSDQMTAMLRAGALQAVDWASWAPNVTDPRLLAPDGTGVKAQSAVPVISFNTSQVRGDDVPHSLQDLLKPQYRGRVASTPYAANFDALASPALWGEARTLDFVARFADQLGGLIRCGETQRIASGEFDVFALDCDNGDVLRLQAQGAPIDYSVATDAALVSPRYLAIPQTAAHPNAARLWLNYMMSREAQDLLYEMTYVDGHLVEGSKTARDLDRVRAAGVPVTEWDVEFYQRNDDEQLKRVLAQIQRIFQRQ
jgi:ABC-type Fe3+ transport system substrate-binding protein